MFKRSKNKKIIGFWAGENYFNFLDPIIKSLEEGGSVIVEKFSYDGDDELLRRQLKKCDIAWFEWARGPIESASKINDLNIPIVCRLHKYEAYIESPRNVNWANVSLLIFISEAVRDTFKRRFPDEIVSVKSTVISNGVDMKVFKADIDRRVGKKIAFNGRFHYHKSPELLLQCFKKISEIDKDYTLHMIGEFVDPVLEEYFWYQVERMGIKTKVNYDGVIDGVEEWLQDKDYFLQPSIIEGQSVAALEAMACGLKPVLHDYYNSTKVFPEKYLFNTIEECCARITKEEVNRNEYYEYVNENNNLEKQIEKIKATIKDLLDAKS
jgi:glycosyltransferase involved in cell wall biosynthesis